MRSLRSRAILWGLGLSALSILVGAVVLVTSVDDIALRRFDTDMAALHLQLTAAVTNGAVDADILATELSDPLYERPYSGRYWQVTTSDGTIITSRSLFDTVLAVPAASRELQYSDAVGPDGAVRLAWRQITPDGEAPMVVAVANSMAQLYAEQWDIRQSLLSGFAIVGLLGLIIAIFQTSAILRPLSTLQKDINRRWDGNEGLDPADYPEEVSPLVSDINILLDRNRNLLERTRRHSADLAHALKTPSAILRNELSRFETAGQTIEIAEEALGRIDAQITRSLTRVRAANLGSPAQLGANLHQSLQRLDRAFTTLFANSEKILDLRVPPDLRVSMDVQDVEEVLGNLLENALKFCRNMVVVSAHQTADATVIRIEDDGPGISAADRIEALRPGGRLDTATRGTGLGLAIASDVMTAYGGTLSLGQSSSLGGLLVVCNMPVRHGL
ncbi:MAG: sensor histidine kinase N-terminal domain-containing protein [Rhodoferax sp.]|nr:sensor histidine kinase N-terminal domain-containing protein [Pseudorhodobacter sp.]